MLIRSFVCALVVLCGHVAAAEETTTLGVGRLFTNDYLGDGHDRWQSGSYAISILRGPADADISAQPFGGIHEYRLRTRLITSDGIGNTPDRVYAGALGFGVHTHFSLNDTRASVGGEVVLIGPQTGLSALQSEFHSAFGVPQVPFVDDQLPNALHFGVSLEAAELMQLTPGVTARPFLELRLGPEDTLRVGADVLIGGTLDSEILIREAVSGQLYRGTEAPDSAGFAFVVGADIAAVGDSIYFPEDGGPNALDDRGRVRAGVHWQGGEDTSLFYGLTYLTPEFEDQEEGQVTGSVKLNFNF